MKSHCCKYTAGLKTILILLVVVSGLSMAQAADKQVIGWLERVHIKEADMLLDAKVDTGADVTSIKANILQKFKRDGVEWVRFRLQNKLGHRVVVERKIERYANIKRSLAPSLQRPVVKLGVCVGKHYRNVEVNLAVRKRFKYNMLVGRNFLRGVFLVDSERQFSVQPACQGVKGD